jgi:hypothetical protein
MKTKTVYVALVHEALNREAFETIADLADAVKTSAAQKRIPYTGADITAAIRSVDARRPLLKEKR